MRSCACLAPETTVVCPSDEQVRDDRAYDDAPCNERNDVERRTANVDEPDNVDTSPHDQPHDRGDKRQLIDDVKQPLRRHSDLILTSHLGQCSPFMIQSRVSDGSSQNGHTFLLADARRFLGFSSAGGGDGGVCSSDMSVLCLSRLYALEDVDHVTPFVERSTVMDDA